MTLKVMEPIPVADAALAPDVTAAPVAALPPTGQRPVAFEPRPRGWRRDEYYDMARSGWFRGQRVLLLAGEVIEMAAQGNWHSVVLGMSEHELRKIFPEDRFWVRTQRPLDLPDGTSDPEPDAAVVPGTFRDYTAHPATALLVVEVADTSLRLDRKKANAYAAAGVQDYWIVDLGGHQVEVYRQPVPDAREPFAYRYASIATLRPGDTINPVAAPHASVAVADLLPKQPVTNPDA